jgi:hypothetical protein
MTPRPLAFVVGTGRTGSTMLSRILRMHPEVLSINELFVSVNGADALPDFPVDGADFWEALSTPNMVFDAMIANGTPLPEFLYNRTPGRHFSAEDGGIPAICLMVLPHLTEDPDTVFEALGDEIPDWPERPIAEHYEALFALLSDRFGGRITVERSGHSLEWVPNLRATFPHAKFVHMYREPADCALSMSRHLGFRSSALVHEVLELAGVESVFELTPEILQNLPSDLAGFTDGFTFEAIRDREVPVTRFGRLWSDMITRGVANLEPIPADERTVLKYEDLLAEPESELIRVAEFIGFEADEKWLRAGAELLDDTRSGAASRLAPEELAALREACEPGIKALGLA